MFFLKKYVELLITILMIINADLKLVYQSLNLKYIGLRNILNYKNDNQ
jgi:hypothetical protein